MDTPKQMYSSVLTVNQDGFFATLQGKFTGRRYYTYTNDQGFGGYTTFDLGVGYDFGIGSMTKAKLALNVTNLTDLRYAANFDNSVFAPTDPHRHHHRGPLLCTAAILCHVQRRTVIACAPR